MQKKNKNKIWQKIILCVCVAATLFSIFAVSVFANNSYITDNYYSVMRYNVGLKPSSVIVNAYSRYRYHDPITDSQVITNGQMLINYSDSFDSLYVDSTQRNNSTVVYRSNCYTPIIGPLQEYYQGVGGDTIAQVDLAIYKSSSYSSQFVSAGYQGTFDRGYIHYGYDFGFDDQRRKTNPDAYDTNMKYLEIESTSFNYDPDTSVYPYLIFPYYDSVSFPVNNRKLCAAISFTAYGYNKEPNSDGVREIDELNVNTVYSGAVSASSPRIDLLPYSLRSDLSKYDYVVFSNYSCVVGILPTSYYFDNYSQLFNLLLTSGTPLDGLYIEHNSVSTSNVIDLPIDDATGFVLVTPYGTSNIFNEPFEEMLTRGGRVLYKDISSITGWIGNTVASFFNIEILPNISLAAVLGILITVSITIWVLKVMAGG